MPRALFTIEQVLSLLREMSPRIAERSASSRFLLHPVVDEFREQVWRHQAPPFGVVRSSWLGRNHLFQGSPLLLEGGYSGADRDQHVPKFDKLRFVAHWAMPGDDLGFRAHFRDVGFSGPDSAVDTAPCRIIDEWVNTIPPRISDVKNISIGEVGVDVGVRV